MDVRVDSAAWTCADIEGEANEPYQLHKEQKPIGSIS